MTTSDWNLFAKEWLAELRQSSPPAESDEGRSATAADVGEAVVFMNFTAAPDQQWQFICSAVAQAESDDELGHIAAGPLGSGSGRRQVRPDGDRGLEAHDD